MVIGNGLLAKRFEAYKNEDGFLIFASGVSNSKITNADAYTREINLLQDSINEYPERTFVYFSTCSVYDPEEKGSVYVQHKLAIEDMIRQEVKKYHLFRISNLAGKTENPNTVLNFFFYHIKNKINFDLWANACRNIIDIDNAYSVMDHVLKNDLFINQAINIANPVSYAVKHIIQSFESLLNIRSNYIEINKGGCYDIDINSVKDIFSELNIRFDNEYLGALLKKYFASL